MHGVEVQTEKVWAEAAASACRASSSLSRLDRERASLERALETLHRDCAREIVPIQLPIGEERGFNGVVDLVSMQAFTFAADGKVTDGRDPGGHGRPRRAGAHRADRDGGGGRRSS